MESSVVSDRLDTFDGDGDDVFAESLLEGGVLPPTGDVTVAAELAGQPRFSSLASCAVAWLSAASSLDTFARADCMVDALVGLADAWAIASAALAFAT
jgi:hypothetical protein